MLSFYPGALIWNQSYGLFTQNYGGWGTKFLNCIFYQKMLKDLSIFRVFHVAKYVDE